MPSTAFDASRRRFLTGEASYVLPPWADAQALYDHCTRCGACIEACPEGILVSDAGFPGVDFRRGECTFCGLCAQTCAEPIFRDKGELPWVQKALIGPDCVTRSGVICQTCGDSCPERAIRFELALGSAPRPRVEELACTGCGACVAVCPADAIVVAEPLRGSGHA
jgi:ferredoxin-type protein NapF